MIKTGFNGFPAIFYAVDAQNVDIVVQLLKYDVDINAVGGPGIPLLAFALFSDRAPESTEMAKLLLAYGANPFVLPRKAYSPILRTDSTIEDEHADGQGQEWYRMAREEFDVKLSEKVYLEMRLVSSSLFFLLALVPSRDHFAYPSRRQTDW